jgi:hypothetical protein
VYIDSKAFAFWLSPENGEDIISFFNFFFYLYIIIHIAVPVSEYIADSTIKDHDLVVLIDFLEELRLEKDVRPVLFHRFAIKKALEESKML